jgi:hypothetical protein
VQLLGSVSEAARALTAAQMAGELSSSSKLSKCSFGSPIIVESCDRWSDLASALTFPSRQRRGGRFARVFSLVGFALAVAIPADAFHFPSFDFWRHLAITRGIEVASSRSALIALEIREEAAVPRLIVNSSRMVSGEPAPLGVSLLGKADGAVMIFTGLVPGMELSTGAPVASDTWEVLAADLGDAWI